MRFLLNGASQSDLSFFISSKTGDDILSEKVRFELSLSSYDEYFNFEGKLCNKP